MKIGVGYMCAIIVVSNIATAEFALRKNRSLYSELHSMLAEYKLVSGQAMELKEIVERCNQKVDDCNVLLYDAQKNCLDIAICTPDGGVAFP